MNSREVLEKLRLHGWVPTRQRGSHIQLEHPEKPGLVTVQAGREFIPIATLRLIERQSGVTLRRSTR